MSSLEINPDLETWIQFEPAGRITIQTGKVEIGQGIRTAVALIAAEELDVGFDRIIVGSVDTDSSPDEGSTFGSNSMEQSGAAIRQVAAHARRLLIERAGAKLGKPTESLSVTDGTVSDGEASVTYWDLVAGDRLRGPIPEDVPFKATKDYSTVGTRVPAQDIESIVTGRPYFVQDLELPGMVHGRVVRPPNYTSRLDSVDDSTVRSMPGVVAVVRDGSFLGVVAETEYQAIRAADLLRRRSVWSDGQPLDTTDIFQQLRENRRTSLNVVDGVAEDGPLPSWDPPSGARTLTATFERPYQMHASIGPSAAAAQWSEGRLTVWTSTQGPYPLRDVIADAVGLEPGDVRLVHVPGSGCYGHNGCDDATYDAVLLSRHVAPRPVLLTWMREDEHAWEPYGSAMVVTVEASLDDSGGVTAWNQEVFSDTHSSRANPMRGKSALLAAWHVEEAVEPTPPQPVKMFHFGIHRNADPLYAFPQRRITKSLVGDLPLRVSALRALGAYTNVFAIESFMDELAAASGSDPLEFRLRHLQDERAAAVLEAVAEAAGWNADPIAAGRGLAFARYKNTKCYCAVAVDLDVDEYGVTSLRRAVIAADAGQVVDPEGLRSQLEGGFVQSASWTLKEEVGFDAGGITTRDWESYPLLSFAEIPEIVTVLIDRPDDPYLGAGEAAQGPSSAAIANAISDATGLRLRRIPLTPERIYSAASAT